MADVRAGLPGLDLYVLEQQGLELVRLFVVISHDIFRNIINTVWPSRFYYIITCYILIKITLLIISYSSLAVMLCAFYRYWAPGKPVRSYHCSSLESLCDNSFYGNPHNEWKIDIGNYGTLSMSFYHIYYSHIFIVLTSHYTSMIFVWSTHILILQFASTHYLWACLSHFSHSICYSVCFRTPANHNTKLPLSSLSFPKCNSLILG